MAFTQLSTINPQPAFAQSPLPDIFNPGANGRVIALAVQADGKILLGGGFTTLGGQTRNRIARLNENGTLDSGFNPGADNWVLSLALQADGKILVGGSFSTLAGQTRIGSGRLSADGILDSGFNAGVSWASYVGLAHTVQADGKILVIGEFNRLAGQPRNYMGRLNADGTLDSGFNPGANASPWCLALQTDRRILVVGMFTKLGGQTRNYIGRLNEDGTLDSGFNPGANDSVLSLALQVDGKILVGGSFSTLAGQTRNRIGRLNADGTLDSGFNPGANGHVWSLAVQADGKILVGGDFTTLGGQTRNRLARLNADGTLDSGFNPGANDSVLSLAMQADGKILVGGLFTTLGGQTRNYLGRLNNTAPATQSLTYNGSTITWLRGGTSPEVWRTTFELCTDGLTWTSLGSGTRRAGGWELAVAFSPPRGVVRARGCVTGGRANSSGWFVESQVQFTNSPTIVKGPQSLTNISGTTVIFTVNATGAAPLAYQWSKDGVALTDGSNVSGARSNVLTLYNVQWAAAGQYTIVVTNTAGSVTSQVASLTVLTRPRFLTQPQNQNVVLGANVLFGVTVAGTPPLNYQWLKDGVHIAGATEATLSLNSVGASASAGYSVVAWNAYGFSVSDTACLAVLTHGANGTTPVQVVPPVCSPPQPGAYGLVIVTHGWSPVPVPAQWVTDLANVIQASVPPGWQAVPIDWTLLSWTLLPDTALVNGKIKGTLLGKQIASQSWQHVHLIGHSAGAALIQAAADTIRQLSPEKKIHTTFLDPYLGLDYHGRCWYGTSADWSDNYFAHDCLTDVPASLTEGPLDNAFNVNITWADPEKSRTPIYCPSITAESTPPTLDQVCGYEASSWHDWPHKFYYCTVLGIEPTCTSGFGFPMSKERGGWDSHGTRPIGQAPVVPCGGPPVTQKPFPMRSDPVLRFYRLPFAASDDGVSLLANSSFRLSSSPAHLMASGVLDGGRQPKDVNPANPTGTPAWLAVGVTTSNTANFVQFDAEFTSTNGAQGLMTVYWNTNQIGAIDERVESPGLHTYRFALPGAVAGGLYTLSFRLDSFANTASSVTVTNVAIGFAGVSQPLTLRMVTSINGAPLLELIGAAGFNYLIQTSTNLVDWAPTALLVNTNGTVLLADPTVTNLNQRFYRAFMP